MRRISGVRTHFPSARRRLFFNITQNSPAVEILERSLKISRGERINSRRQSKIIILILFNNDFVCRFFFLNSGGGLLFLAIYMPVIKAATLKLQNSGFGEAGL